jgi:competence protein CoiA
MQLVALDCHTAVLAQDAERGKTYSCPECLNPVRLRKGIERQPHFYHLAKASFCKQQGKSLTHLQVQRHLQLHLPQGETVMEKPFPHIGRIADLFWERHRIVFEVQCSPLSLEEAKARCADYKQAGCTLVWILHRARFNQKKLSAAESFLRQFPCYFTTIDETGRGFIYDQFDICQSGRRLFRGPPLKIDASKPHPLLPLLDQNLPKAVLNRRSLYFEGDLVDLMLKQENGAKMRELEERFAIKHSPFSPVPFSLAVCLKKSYLTLFHALLERASR